MSILVQSSTLGALSGLVLCSAYFSIQELSFRIQIRYQLFVHIEQRNLLPSAAPAWHLNRNKHAVDRRCSREYATRVRFDIHGVERAFPYAEGLAGS